MRSITLLHRLITVLAASLPLVISGCGGSGGGSPAVPTTTVSGSVLAGPATGSSVVVKTTAGATVAGPVLTATDGSYLIDIPTSDLASELVFEASGGSFDDEVEQSASGKGVVMGKLSALISGGTLAAGANVSLDPSSTIVRKLVAGGMTRTSAESAFNSAFGYVPDCSVKPAFATMSSASTIKQRLAGIRAAAFSQLTRDLGLTPDKQFELIQALADDLSDGTLDGKTGGTTVTMTSGTALPEDIANRFVQALVTFQTSSLNRCRLTADQVGTLPFSKTALTASYKVEYLPGAAVPAQGKSTFRIKLTDRVSGAAVSGKTVTLLPYMHMATKSHSTPMDAVVDNGDGTYSCTIYYLMPTVMNGIPMGFWELKVTIGSETAIFYPTVAMSTGTTSRVTLRGVNDTISVGGMTEKRAYNIFFDGLSAGTGGTYTYNVFVSAKESMVSWPGVSMGTQLHDQAGAAWSITAMTVQGSTDGTTWLTATDNGSGHWSIAGLTGFTAGTSGTLYLKMTINNEQKTTDGTALGTTNGAAAFTVVP